MAGGNDRNRDLKRDQGVMSGWLAWAVLGGVGAIALPVLGEIIFGLLGIIPEDPAWRLVLLFGGLWALVAGRLPLEWHRATGKWPSSLSGLTRLGGGIRSKNANSRSSQAVLGGWTWASRIASGALLGFFYGGRWTGDDMRGAIAGLLLGLVLSLGLGLWLARAWPELERVMGVAIALFAAYGLWFWFGAWGLSALMAGQGLPALLYGGVALSFCQWAWLASCWFRAVALDGSRIRQNPEC